MENVHVTTNTVFLLIRQGDDQADTIVSLLESNLSWIDSMSADTNLHTSDGDDNGSILHLCCSLGRIRTIQTLIERFTAININIKDNFLRCPLSIAIEHHHVNIVQYLLERGADFAGFINAESFKRSQDFSYTMAASPDATFHYGKKTAKTKNMLLRQKVNDVPIVLLPLLFNSMEVYDVLINVTSAGPSLLHFDWPVIFEICKKHTDTIARLFDSHIAKYMTLYHQSVEQRHLTAPELEMFLSYAIHQRHLALIHALSLHYKSNFSWTLASIRTLVPIVPTEEIYIFLCEESFPIDWRQISVVTRIQWLQSTVFAAPKATTSSVFGTVADTWKIRPPFIKALLKDMIKQDNSLDVILLPQRVSQATQWYYDAVSSTISILDMWCFKREVDYIVDCLFPFLSLFKNDEAAVGATPEPETPLLSALPQHPETSPEESSVQSQLQARLQILQQLNTSPSSASILTLPSITIDNSSNAGSVFTPLSSTAFPAPTTPVPFVSMQPVSVAAPTTGTSNASFGGFTNTNALNSPFASMIAANAQQMSINSGSLSSTPAIQQQSAPVLPPAAATSPLERISQDKVLSFYLACCYSSTSRDDDADNSSNSRATVDDVSGVRSDNQENDFNVSLHNSWTNIVGFVSANDALASIANTPSTTTNSNSNPSSQNAFSFALAPLPTFIPWYHPIPVYQWSFLLTGLKWSIVSNHSAAAEYLWAKWILPFCQHFFESSVSGSVNDRMVERVKQDVQQLLTVLMTITVTLKHDLQIMDTLSSHWEAMLQRLSPTFQLSTTYGTIAYVDEFFYSINHENLLAYQAITYPTSSLCDSGSVQAKDTSHLHHSSTSAPDSSNTTNASTNANTMLSSAVEAMWVRAQSLRLTRATSASAGIAAAAADAPRRMHVPPHLSWVSPDMDYLAAVAQQLPVLYPYYLFHSGRIHTAAASNSNFIERSEELISDIVLYFVTHHRDYVLQEHILTIFTKENSLLRKVVLYGWPGLRKKLWQRCAGLFGLPADHLLNDHNNTSSGTNRNNTASNADEHRFYRDCLEWTQAQWSRGSEGTNQEDEDAKILRTLNVLLAQSQT